MEIHNLSDQPSILNTFVSEIRSTNIQNDRMRFRRNIERIGEVLGYELSKHLDYKSEEIETPLGVARTDLHKNDLVICSILRAGVPLHNGILNYFDTAGSAFVSAYRKHDNGSESFKIILEYLSCPDLNNKTLILLDTMLATGQSMVAAYKALNAHGTPSQIHLVSAIGAKAGVDYISQVFGDKVHLWIAAIDKDLNSKGYIIPGLGDAGDLAFGSKLQE